MNKKYDVDASRSGVIDLLFKAKPSGYQVGGAIW